MDRHRHLTLRINSGSNRTLFCAVYFAKKRTVCRVRFDAFVKRRRCAAEVKYTTAFMNINILAIKILFGTISSFNKTLGYNFEHTKSICKKTYQTVFIGFFTPSDISTNQHSFLICQLNNFRACPTIGLSRGKSSRPILIY
jgi:hypothetical protein